MDYVKEMRALVGNRPLIFVGSCVLVLDEANRILFNLRTDNGFWGLPGGMMELGETLEETACREVMEETGLSVGDLTLLDVFSGQELFYQYPNGDQVHNVTAAYWTRVFSGDLVANDESHKLQFFSVEEIPTTLSPAIRPIVEKFVSKMSGMVGLLEG